MKRRQKGSALFIALVILVLITVIALNLANSGKVDLAAIGAYQNKKQTDEVALAAIEQELNEALPAVGAERNSTYTNTPLGVSVALKTRYRTITEPPLGGFTLGEGFSAFHYQVEATATGANNSSAEMEQGFYVLGPSS